MAAEHLTAVSDFVALNPLSPRDLLHSAGLWALWIVIFAETGLLVGFFLPGDTILFLAGIASSAFATDLVGTQLPITPLLIVTPLCAIAGAQVGHFLGSHYGVKMFDRPNSRLFKREHVEKTEQVFERFGQAKAVVLARFIPVVRTFLNPVAGILEMPARKFFVWNLIGAIIWTDGILLAGHLLAKQITDIVPADKIDNYLVPIIVVIVLISATPMIIDIIRKRRANRGERGGAHRESAQRRRSEADRV
jgi:membrane-associated protein